MRINIHISQHVDFLIIKKYRVARWPIRISYQNKLCKAYYLPLDNGGYPFEWVSNYQVLTAVHLNPLKTKNRTFTLPAGDKKTATEAMEKRREGRQ